MEAVPSCLLSAGTAVRNCRRAVSLLPSLPAESAAHAEVALLQLLTRGAPKPLTLLSTCRLRTDLCALGYAVQNHCIQWRCVPNTNTWIRSSLIFYVDVCSAFVDLKIREVSSFFLQCFEDVFTCCFWDVVTGQVWLEKKSLFGTMSLRLQTVAIPLV